MYKVKVLILCLVVGLIFSTCTSTSVYFGKVEVRKEQILHYSNAAEPSSLDPHKTAGIPEGNIIMSFLDRLTDYDAKTLEPRPALAERWESADQARKWIFYLRKDAFWTDKSPVTAHDFVWAWQRAINPETATRYVFLLYYVKNGEAISQGKMPVTELGVKAIDDYTLEVEMQQPTAFFIKMTPHFVFSPLPRKVVEKYGDKWTAPENIVSCGPFKLAKHKPYDLILLVKNPDYWDVANVKLDKAYFYPIDNGSTNTNLYKAGELDVMQSGGIPPSFIKTLRKKKDYVSGAFFTTCYYSLNVKKKPLDDVRVRRALNMAIDKSAITDKLIGKGDIPATSFIPPGISGYPKVIGDSYDPEKAKKLMAEAGFADGKGFPTITIYFNSLEANRQIAEAIQKMWKQSLNINAELQNEEWQTFTARQERHEFDVARDSWTGDYLDPDTFLNLFATNTPNNHPGWVNEQYTKLLQEANQEPDEVKRSQMLAQVEKILLDETVIIPIYFYALSYMQKPYIEGWYPNLFDIHPLKQVSINTDWQPEMKTTMK
ncbi:MAG: peptide ABC transporter substrate-binding protein [Acidobacteria bacterium]|nr:peptide ABC transporter substrate-binding protein [Acidobacteriota bacterium]